MKSRLTARDVHATPECEKQDAETFELCRDGSTDTPRYAPILPFVTFVLFTGMRVSDALQIRGSDIEEGELHVRAPQLRGPPDAIS